MVPFRVLIKIIFVEIRLLKTIHFEVVQSYTSINETTIMNQTKNETTLMKQQIMKRAMNETQFETVPPFACQMNMIRD